MILAGKNAKRVLRVRLVVFVVLVVLVVAFLSYRWTRWPKVSDSTLLYDEAASLLNRPSGLVPVDEWPGSVQALSPKWVGVHEDLFVWIGIPSSPFHSRGFIVDPTRHCRSLTDGYEFTPTDHPAVLRFH
jgi:hypothetical protein